MKKVFKTLTIGIMMVMLSATAGFAQNEEGDNSSSIYLGGTWLKVVAQFPTGTNTKHIIENALATITWHDPSGSGDTFSKVGVKTGPNKYEFYFWTPIGGSLPVWVTYQVSGSNGANTYGHFTKGTYYLQSNNDVLYITTWLYTWETIVPPPPEG
jgi:hypothetical protein